MSMQRGEWSSRMGFILAAAGSAVGLGNIWGFPIQTAQNGGAAFVFVYIVLTFVVCFPIVITEIAIGRRTGKNPAGALNELAPGTPWNLVGKLGVLCGFMILSFYIVLAGWVFGYFLEVITGGLATIATDGEFAKFIGSPWKNLLYMFLFMGATVSIVLGGVKDGIEKWARYLMPTLIIMLFALIIYILTRDGAMAGLSYYIIPDFSKITMKTVNSGLSQAFFSLSLGMGALITYGSYVSKKENIIASGMIVTGLDTFIAFSAGLLILPAVFTLPGLEISEVNEGPGLLFVVLPKVFMHMTASVGYFGASFVAAFFFLLICFAALTSTISLLEVPTAYIVDENGLDRKKAALSAGIIITLLGIGSLLGNGASDFFSKFITYPSGESKDFLSFVADVFNASFLPLGGFLITAFTAFKWKTHNLSEEIAQGNPGFKGSVMEKLITTMLYICPFIILFIFLNTVAATYFGYDLF